MSDSGSSKYVRAGSSSKSRAIKLLTKNYADTGLHILNEFEKAEKEILFENCSDELINVP